MDGITLNPDLKARLERYSQFLAWAGLVSKPVAAGSVMRSPATAHKISTSWMFDLDNNTASSSTLTTAANRQKLVARLEAGGGSDLDGTEWVSSGDIDALKAAKDDDEKLKTTLKPIAAKGHKTGGSQKKQAAEGYTTADKRHPNILPGTGVSNHLKGEAVDIFFAYTIPNFFDPVIDAMALYFGLYRACKELASSPEHWHYERLGAPPGTGEDVDH
jgi:hypothetical protein